MKLPIAASYGVLDPEGNKIVKLFVFKFAIFKGFPFLLNFWINESYGYFFVHRTIKSSLIPLILGKSLSTSNLSVLPVEILPSTELSMNKVVIGLSII